MESTKLTKVTEVTEVELNKIKNKLEMEGMKKTKELVMTNSVTEKNITSILKEGEKQFIKETGRQMTYGEMREMYG